MAEAQKTPVIVDEDEQLKTFSVQEEIDAGKLVLPKTEETVEQAPTDEKGIPRIEIAPVSLKPRPSEKTLKSSIGMPLGEYDVSLSKEGVPLSLIHI